MIHGRPITLSSGCAPPTEFRLFTRGWNETENGRFLFDDVAAKSVMAAYSAWGVDLCVDLEHQSLEIEAGESPDPTARDARGWFKLDLRRDGSLWAVRATWTADGAQRLAEKRQRYISPAFEVDPKSKRILKMINAGLTSLPATHNTPALVAASVAGRRIILGRNIAMASFDPAKSSPADASKIIVQIAALLGLGANASHDEIDQGLDQCFAIVTGANGGNDDAASKMTPAQLAICRETGCSPSDFLHMKRAFGVR